MAIDVFEIDKSGFDLFNQDYSIIVVKNNKEVFGVNIPQRVRDNLFYEYNRRKQ